MASTPSGRMRHRSHLQRRKQRLRDDPEAPSRPDPEGKTSRTPLDLVTKPFLWLAVLVVGALGGSIQGWLQPRFTDTLDQLTETGDPVQVFTQVRPPSGLENLWLPPERTLSDQEIQELNNLEPEGQWAMLRNMGAIPIGTLELEIHLAGNRSGEVLITDLRPTSDCREIVGGSFLQTGIQGGGFPSTLRMRVDVGDPSTSPLIWDGGNVGTDQDLSGTPFFDERTISLGKNEQEFILAEVWTTHLACTGNLQLTVLHRQEEETQLLLPLGQGIQVAGLATQEDGSPSAEFDHIFVGGWRCLGFTDVAQGPVDEMTGCPAAG